MPDAGRDCAGDQRLLREDAGRGDPRGQNADFRIRLRGDGTDVCGRRLGGQYRL